VLTCPVWGEYRLVPYSATNSFDLLAPWFLILLKFNLMVFDPQVADFGLINLAYNILAEKICWHFISFLVNDFKILFHHWFLDL
jgi:hypothetical protein